MATAIEYQQQLAQLQRRRAIADALMQNAINPQAGVGTTRLGVLVGALGAGLGARQQGKLDKQYADIAKEMGASRVEALRRLAGAPPTGQGPAAIPRDPGMSLPGTTTNFETNAVTAPAAAMSAPRGPDFAAAQEAIDLGANPTIVASALKPPKENDPNSVREFEYAKQNGFTGSFQDWVKMGGQTSRPSSVQEWEFYNALPADQKPLYLEMKRNPNMVVKDIGQVPTVIAPRVSGTTTTPLSTLPKEAAGASTIKQAEASGGAFGKAQGEIAGGIQTKGANAVGTKNLLDIAEPLIDVATGSRGGAAVDAVTNFFGAPTSGAQAIAKLKVLQAGLMTSMPRMEGPQSDADVKLYREAAGQIGDPTVPAELKKAAVQTIRQIQDKYIERAGGAPAAPTSFASEAEAEAAARAGTLKSGTKIVINGVSGTWQ